MLEGVSCSDRRVSLFMGIPFAAAPVGGLRWRPPQSAHCWEGVYKADHFAPISMQDTPGSDANDFYSKELHPNPDLPMSEDCLYLNIWTPAKTGEEKLAVMIWFFGGGFRSGYTYEMEFDGERIARRDVILVTVNYRLNAFGFLAHPELSAEDPGGCQGNYGLQDQQAGIGWVRRNIAAFGGDPDRITINGQSAGAAGVLCQVTSAQNKGLLAGAIMQSGGGLRAFGYGAPMNSLEAAEQNGIGFLSALGASSIEDARTLPADKILKAVLSYPCSAPWGPTVDGRFLSEDPTQAILHNRHLDIPYLFGNTSGEVPGTPASGSIPESVEAFETLSRKTYGRHAATFLSLCHVKNKDDLVRLYQTDAFNMRSIGNRLFCLTQAQQGRPSYAYYFDHDIPGSDHPGAFHGSDLWFTFESLSKCWRPFTGKHYDLARQVCHYWINFVKRGNPNGNDSDGSALPEWKAYTAKDPFILCFGDTPGRDTRESDEIMRFRLDFYLGRL